MVKPNRSASFAMSSVPIRLCGFFFEAELSAKHVGIGLAPMMQNISTNALMTSGENTTALINETPACGAPMVPILFGWREVHTTMAVLKFY